MRTTLQDLPSGKIELVDDGTFYRLEFNTSCMDALPYCQAICCKRRLLFAPRLRSQEKQKLETQQRYGQQVLAVKSDGSCVYLGADSKCEIHDNGKPEGCANWHCSPGGVGDGLVFRGHGWIINPVWHPGEVSREDQIVRRLTGADDGRRDSIEAGDSEASEGEQGAQDQVQ